MREIKFRAYLKSLKDNDGNIICSEKKVFPISLIDFKEEIVSIDYDLDPENDEIEPVYFFLSDVELMQYTGRTDNNDLEVYEGDVVNCKFYGYGYGFSEGCERNFFITYCGGESRFRCIPIDKGVEPYFNQIFRGEIEVVGNIYENKELLNERD